MEIRRRRPLQDDATSAKPEVRFECSVPDGVLDAVRGVIREEVAAALDAQTQRPRLLDDRRLCAEVLDVSISTLRTKLLPAGLPYVMVADCRRYEVEQVLAWLRAQPAAAGGS